MPTTYRIAGFVFLVLATAVAWPQTAPAYPEAATYVQQGKFDLAIPILEKLVAASPRDLKARNLLGIALLSSGRKSDAVIQFQKILDLDPAFRAALKNIAVAEVDLGRPKPAQLHFEQLLKLVPGDPVAHFYLGVIFAGAQRPDDAIRHFELARNGYPDPYTVSYNLMLSQVNAHKTADAILTGEQLVAEGKAKPEIYNLLARAYESANRTQQAYDALRTATQLDPQDETNYLDLMLLCLTHENWDLSLEIADVALARIPQSYRVRLQRGAVLALQGKMDEAEKEFQTAARVAPAQTDLPAVLVALVEIDTGKFTEAAAQLRARSSSKDYRVHWLLGEALARDGADPGSAAEKEAFTALQQAVRLNPKSAQPRVLLGKLMMKRGDNVSAVAQLEEALKLDPEEISAAYQLAILYRNQGNTKRAEELAAMVSKARSAPETRFVRSNLAKIIRER